MRFIETFNLGNDASKVRSNSSMIFLSLVFLSLTSLHRTVRHIYIAYLGIIQWHSQILDFPFELSSFTREQLNNWYSVNSFFLAKTTANILPQVWSQNCIFFQHNTILIKGHHPAVFRYHFLHYDMPTSGIFKAPTLSNNFLFMQVQFEEKLPFYWNMWSFTGLLLKAGQKL